MMKARIIVKSPAGFTVEFETPELENRHTLLEVLPRFEEELREAGYTPAGDGPAPAAPAPAGLGSFVVDRITATVDDGKAYWRVKGGEFQKFGVIIYPEVLEAAGLGDLNPLKAFDEPGWVAYYSLKENGQPKKVTRLEKGI